MKTAKVFKNGRSQAVRIPREFQFTRNEVFVQRTKDGLLLTEKDPWELFAEGVRELEGDWLTERRQPPVQQRDFGG